MFIFNCLLQKEVKSIGIFPAAIFARVRGGKCWLFLRNRNVLPKAVDRNPNASSRVHVTSLRWVCSFHSLNSSVLIDKMGRISCTTWSRWYEIIRKYKMPHTLQVREKDSLPWTPHRTTKQEHEILPTSPFVHKCIPLCYITTYSAYVIQFLPTTRHFSRCWGHGDEWIHRKPASVEFTFHWRGQNQSINKNDTCETLVSALE